MVSRIRESWIPIFIFGVLFLFIARGKLGLPVFPDGFEGDRLGISGVMTDIDHPDGMIIYESDVKIRRFLETRYTDRPVSGPKQCMLLGEEQRRMLRSLGGQVHVRGTVRRMIMSQRCPDGRTPRGNVYYAEALRPVKLEDFVVMPCDAELYVVTEGRCRP
jgi:hypothetical protein